MLPYYHVDRHTDPQRILRIKRLGVNELTTSNFYVDTDPLAALKYIQSMEVISPSELACDRAWSTNSMCAYTIYKIESQTHNPAAYKNALMLKGSTPISNLRLDFNKGKITPQEIKASCTILTPLIIAKDTDQMSDAELDTWHDKNATHASSSWEQSTLDIVDYWTHKGGHIYTALPLTGTNVHKHTFRLPKILCNDIVSISLNEVEKYKRKCQAKLDI